MSRPVLTLVVVLAALVAVPAAEALPLHALTPVDCIRDNDTGSAACGQLADGLDNAFDVAVSPDGSSVYAAATIDNAIVRFNRTPDGTLTPAGCIDDNDTGPDTCATSTDGLNTAVAMAVSPDGKSVYVLGGLEDAIVRFNRTPDGTLTPAGCIDDNDTGPDTCATSTDGLDGANDVAVSPDGTSVYVASNVDDAVVTFNRATDGSLTFAACVDDNDTGPEACGSSTDGLDGPFGITVSPDGKSVYVASDGDDAVVEFDRGPSGSITTPSCIDDNDSGADVCGSSTDGLDQARSVAVSPDGLSVYATSRGDDAVTRLGRDAGGEITPGECLDDNDTGPEACPLSADGLDNAQGVVVSPEGDSVFVASFTDSALVRFDRSSTGVLTSAGCIDDPSVGPDACTTSAVGLSGALNPAMPADGSAVFVAGSAQDAVVRIDREVPARCFGHAGAGVPGAPQSIVLDCADPNGDALFLRILSGPANGTLGDVNQAAGTVTYTPNLGFTGADSMTFEAVSDGKSSNAATATIVVEPATGPQGAPGANGAPGSPGAQGSAGSQGPQGPAGRNAQVTCKVKKKGAKVKATCTVKLVLASRARLHWRLARGPRIYARGVAVAHERRASVKLNLSGLARGRYLLRIAGRHGAVAIAVS